MTQTSQILANLKQPGFPGRQESESIPQHRAWWWFLWQQAPPPGSQGLLLKKSWRLLDKRCPRLGLYSIMKPFPPAPHSPPHVSFPNLISHHETRPLCKISDSNGGDGSAEGGRGESPGLAVSQCGCSHRGLFPPPGTGALQPPASELPRPRDEGGTVARCCA